VADHKKTTIAQQEVVTKVVEKIEKDDDSGELGN
jgi:hypothetical protein